MGKSMLEKTNIIDETEFSLSVEEFDRLTGEHEFSEKYKTKKAKMLKEYRRSVSAPSWERWIKAAAAFLLILTMPVLVGKAAGSDFFNRVWGALGKENIESHEEVVFDEEKGTSCAVTYPRREYTNDTLDKAEELVGNPASFAPIVKEIGDTRLTILASAYDGNAAVVEFTLEKEGGVEGFCYGQLDNESKGAWFAADAPFRFFFADCGENIYVDLEKSTKDILYCYDYIVAALPDQAQGLTLEIYQNQDHDEDVEAPTDTLFVPFSNKIDKKEYVNADGGNVNLSPIAMNVDVNTGLGLDSIQAYDPWNVYYVAINYVDGTSYVVHEHEVDGIHSCEVEIENTGYTCGSEDGHLVFVFNRLVDMGKVESVIVNEAVYTLK